jgi:peptide/nickel transport system substrate-binding protein
LRIREFGALRVCAVILTAVALTIPIAAMTDAFVGRAEAESESVLKIGFMQKVDSMNPNVGLVDAAYVFYGLVYDTPHCIDNHLNITGNLCIDWYVDEDYEPYGSAWIMEYTQNAYWHDGERFDADDVAFTINLNAEFYQTMWAYQPYAYYMDYAEKVDDYTVRVFYCDRVTREPMPAAYARMICIPILPEHKLRTLTPSEISFGWEGVFDNSDPPIVGTGPFMATENIYDEFLKGDKLTFVKNPNYFWKYEKEGAPEVSFDGLEMHFFNDATAMAYALEMGVLDVAQFPPHEYTTLKSKVSSGALENIVAYDGPKCTQYWTEVAFCLNNAGPNPSRLDLSIRQALAMATNKEHINDNYYLGFGEPGTTLIPPVNSWHYEPTDAELYKYDLQAARDLLEASGYRITENSPSTPSGEKVRVCTADSYAVQELGITEGKPLIYEMGLRQEYPEEKDIAMYLESEWAKIGVQINYKIMTEAALGAYVYAYACDTFLWYWSADVDPMYQLFCQSKVAWDGWNDNMYTSAAYEENFTKSVQEFDEDLRREYVDNCQKVHYRDVSYIILSYVGQTYGWRTDTFEGWGDWDADPGRSVDNFWTGNPLYFDLEYIGSAGGEVPWIALAAGLGVVAAAVAAVVLLKRRGGKKGKKKEEKTSPLGE